VLKQVLGLGWDLTLLKLKFFSCNGNILIKFLLLQFSFSSLFEIRNLLFSGKLFSSCKKLFLLLKFFVEIL